MTPGEFALCISGWVMFASLVTVWIGRDRADKRLAKQLRTERGRAHHWKARALAAEAERVARVIQFPIGGAS